MISPRDDETGRDQRLARDPRVRVVRENRVEDGVGDLVGDLVRMAFGDRLGGERERAGCRHGAKGYLGYSVVGSRRMSCSTRSVSATPRARHTTFGDRQLDVERPGEIAEDGRRRQPFDDHPDLGAGLLRGRALGDELTGAPVPARRRPARDDQVAHPRQPREGVRACACRLREPPHLRNPAGDERRLRVVPEAESVGPARGERDHVLGRRAQLHSHDVLVDDAEDRRVQRELKPDRELEICACDDRGRREPLATSSAMFGPERTATGRPATSDDSRSPVLGSSPFVRLSTGEAPGSAPTTSPKTREGTATTTSSALSIGASSTRAAAIPLSVGFSRVARIPSGFADRGDLLGVASRQRHVVAAVAEQARERRAPRARPDDDSFHSK